MNELQKVEIDILKHFIYTCEMLKLNYFLVCGSALGAIKYSGFIPWDDDIDVALLRPDYEVFISKAQDILPEYLFLQTYKTDAQFPQIYAKIRNSNTTYIEKSTAKLNINHGIYIDVFPLDGYPSNKIDQIVLEGKKRMYRRALAYSCEAPRYGLSKMMCAIYRLFGVTNNTAKIAKRYDDAVSKFSINSSEILCNHGNWQGKKDYCRVSQFLPGVKAYFEGLEVTVPFDCDGYLRQKYGDYWADLPDELKCGHHYYSVYDIKKPYKSYINY